MKCVFKVLLCLALALAVPAAAQTNVPTKTCRDAAVNPVYVTGSTAVRPFLVGVAKALAAETPPSTVVYQGVGSCVGVAAVYSTDVSKRLMRDIPASGGRPANYAVYYRPDGSTEECALDAAGTPVDVGVSDAFASTCGFSTAPAGTSILDYQGPIQPMVFVAPGNSTQKNISAEAAYIAFGTKGQNGTIGPWNDPSLFFVRSASSGTQALISLAIKVPANQWWGTDRLSSDELKKNLISVVDPKAADKAIGILSSDFADEERNNLKELAFQGFGQKCAYWPDSTPLVFDKRNVREGRYVIWGPVHFYARTTDGVPAPSARSLLLRFAAPKLDVKLVDEIIARRLVPKCAMKVQRDTEMGPMIPFTPAAPCGCYFDKSTTGATPCAACSTSNECPTNAPLCSYGFCEKPG
jgi:ABC-type phosphate transport system substrate-binding protein